MNKRTRALQIPRKVKEAVFKRDGGRCVGCGRWAQIDWACAHFIARSHGGLGIEENVLTLCPECHSAFDNGVDRRKLQEKYHEYLKNIYGVDKCLVYRKGKDE